MKLFHDYGVSIKDVEDLSDLANRKIGGDSKKWGLASLTETLVCKEVSVIQKLDLNFENNSENCIYHISVLPRNISKQK